MTKFSIVCHAPFQIVHKSGEPAHGLIKVTPSKGKPFRGLYVQPGLLHVEVDSQGRVTVNPEPSPLADECSASGE